MAEETAPSVEQSLWIVDSRRRMLAQAPEYKTAIQLITTRQRTFFEQPGKPLVSFFKGLFRRG